MWIAQVPWSLCCEEVQLAMGGVYMGRERKRGKGGAEREEKYAQPLLNSFSHSKRSKTCEWSRLWLTTLRYHLPATIWGAPRWNHPAGPWYCRVWEMWKTYYFKSLSFGVVCYAKIDTWNRVAIRELPMNRWVGGKDNEGQTSYPMLQEKFWSQENWNHREPYVNWQALGNESWNVRPFPSCR